MCCCHMLSVLTPLLRLSPPPTDKDYCFNLADTEGVCDLFDIDLWTLGGLFDEQLNCFDSLFVYSLYKMMMQVVPLGIMFEWMGCVLAGSVDRTWIFHGQFTGLYVFYRLGKTYRWASWKFLWKFLWKMNNYTYWFKFKFVLWIVIDK